jgi:hypothetical protein
MKKFSSMFVARIETINVRGSRVAKVILSYKHGYFYGILFPNLPVAHTRAPVARTLGDLGEKSRRVSEWARYLVSEHILTKEEARSLREARESHKVTP